MGAQGGNFRSFSQSGIEPGFNSRLTDPRSQGPNWYIIVNYNELLASILTTFHSFQFVPNNTTSHVSLLLSRMSSWAIHNLLDVFYIFQYLSI